MKEVWLFWHFYLILKIILCVLHFSSFGAILLIVNLLRKTDSTVISDCYCAPFMLGHVCSEPFSLQHCRFGIYLADLEYLMLIG